MRGCFGAVEFDQLKLLNELFFGHFALRESQEKTHHESNLGAQKTVGFKNKNKISFVGVGESSVDNAGEMFGITTTFFEQFKVMYSDKTLYGISNHIAVKFGDKSDKIVFKGVGVSLFEDIAIGPFFSTKACMKIILNPLDFCNAHRSGKLKIEHIT